MLGNGRKRKELRSQSLKWVPQTLHCYVLFIFASFFSFFTFFFFGFLRQVRFLIFTQKRSAALQPFLVWGMRDKHSLSKLKKKTGWPAIRYLPQSQEWRLKRSSNVRRKTGDTTQEEGGSFSRKKI